MDDVYFFDTYAFFEIIKSNPDYAPYKEVSIITTKLNLFELYYGNLRDTDEETADILINKYFDFIIDFDKDIIIEAAKFRFNNRNRNLSMTDCIGYILSLSLGIKFLTGDKEFENIEGVEYIKK